jgi:hypothetical protein
MNDGGLFKAVPWSIGVMEPWNDGLVETFFTNIP